ncbi:hypothetical protein DSM3645_20787 [Blastopirellula marina DSM 3645]|uniref:Uncharacterized protein n=1 Tax=Blastopirellula marina DSM 3645 TaxID=314230 RepID=A3ZQV7_9BACT|nr:hypothetical protein DSM3645_20787 [Blastopirellula marina DSM 3645]
MNDAPAQDETALRYRALALLLVAATCAARLFAHRCCALLAM